MKWYRIAAILLAITVFLLLFEGAGPSGPSASPLPAGKGPGQEVRISDPILCNNATPATGNTVFFSKYVSEETPYILVDLYSGDQDDPLALTILSPDKTLGPFSDGSDGRTDGRIFLKISRENGLRPGLWKFVVHSRRNISSLNSADFSRIWHQIGTNSLMKEEE